MSHGDLKKCQFRMSLLLFSPSLMGRMSNLRKAYIACHNLFKLMLHVTKGPYPQDSAANSSKIGV